MRPIGCKTTQNKVFKNKAVVLGMLEKGGEVMTKVVPNRHNSTLVKEVRENIIKGSEIHVYVALYGLFRRV